MNARDADPMMSPVNHNRRIEAVDILRGLAVLGMLAVNMLDFSGYSRLSPQEMGTAHRLTILFIRFFAQAKFYPLFAFLFGWGSVIQMSRAEEREEAFVPLSLRRLIVLMLIGTVHAVLIWEVVAA